MGGSRGAQGHVPLQTHTQICILLVSHHDKKPNCYKCMNKCELIIISSLFSILTTHINPHGREKQGKMGNKTQSASQTEMRDPPL